MYKYTNYIVLIILVLISSCTTKIHKSGFNNTDKLSISLNGLSKKEIISKIGTPSTIDPIDNNFIYFSETKKEKNIFNKKIISRNVYVINFDKNNYFKGLKHYKMEDGNKLRISKNTTDTNIIKTGLIEKIFGGVGTNTSLPSN